MSYDVGVGNNIGDEYTILLGERAVSYEPLTMIDMMRNTVNKYQDRTAIIFDEYQLTYKEFDDKVRRFATYLQSLGVKKETNVVIILPNCVHTVIATYAVWLLGGIVVMNNPMYTDREVQVCLSISASEHVICMDSLAERILNLELDVPIKSVTTVALMKTQGDTGNDAPTYEGNRIHDFFECISNNSQFETEVQYDWDQAACLQFTGGTTGIIKAAALSHRNLSIVLQNYCAWFYDLENGKETILSAIPLFHVYGMQLGMNLSVFLGATNVLIMKPTPQVILSAIQRNQVTCCPLVPTIYIRLLQCEELGKQNFDLIKAFTSGGSVLPAYILEKFKEITGKVIVEGYGLSEAAPITHINPYGKYGNVRLGSIGKLCPNTQARIIDNENGKELTQYGEYGELLVRGGQVAQGYYKNPEETDNAFDKDGWLHTGDIAYVDKEEYFFIVGRKKEVIISSENNIYPREIEDVLGKHPSVVNVAVVGVPNEIRGESVVVFVILKKDTKVTLEELMTYCQERLAKYKWPVKIIKKDTFPMNSSGKILKRELVSSYIKEN